jgi:hypothetical protein
MPGRSRYAVIALSIAAIAACSKTAPTTDNALQRDLALAKGQGIELAPQGGTQLVSANELLPAGSRTKVTTVPARHSKPAATPVRQAVAQTPAPAPSAPARDSAVAQAPATPRPSAQGAISPEPRGGYKSMGELIRKAPFPINP